MCCSYLAVCGVQLLVVAGGRDDSFSYLDTVELLRDYRTATSWVVATGRLHRAVKNARMTLVGPHLYLTGGRDSNLDSRTGECLPPRPLCLTSSLQKYCGSVQWKRTGCRLGTWPLVDISTARSPSPTPPPTAPASATSPPAARRRRQLDWPRTATDLDLCI